MQSLARQDHDRRLFIFIRWLEERAARKISSIHAKCLEDKLYEPTFGYGELFGGAPGKVQIKRGFLA